jgi:8-oxo-dGTP diphosphatase
MDDVRAAGAVVTRKGGDVVLVHRPKYDDWSFPKGKVDPGEHVTAAAVREVAEETGLQVRLGPPLPGQRYGVGNGRMKAVSYWTARVVGDDDLSGYDANAEIDQVQWVPWDKAQDLLSYRRDRALLEASAQVRRRTHALVVLRHAVARDRESWSFEDRRRPLSPEGQDQAERLVPVLAAFGVTGVHTSSSTRCIDTVRPFTEVTGLDLVPYDALTEEEAGEDEVRAVVEELLAAKECTVLCGHRPVLPTILDALGVPEVRLEKGEMVVVQHRGGAVVSTERHLV